MDDTLRGKFKCNECGEENDWQIKEYYKREGNDETGLINYVIFTPCFKCRIEHIIDIDFDGKVKIANTGRKYRNNEKTLIAEGSFKSKTKEELYEKVKQIFIKYINE